MSSSEDTTDALPKVAENTSLNETMDKLELGSVSAKGDGGGRNAPQDEETDALPAGASQSEVDANPLAWSTSSTFIQPVTILTSRESPQYVMSGIKKLIILNHRTFMPRLKLNDRRGTDIDVKAIESTFKPLDWDIEVKDDCTVSQIRETILRIQISQEVWTGLAFFILSHGEDNGTVFAKDGLYRVDHDILYPLAADKCPMLAGKPKMIFVQACQGQDTDSGTSVLAGGRMRHTSADSTTTYKIPNYADFVIFQASFWQHYSFRSGDTGSWFIQALCDKINKSGPDDAFFDILLDVSAAVALNKESNVPQKPHLDKKKQVPLLYSTMLRKLYLKERPATPTKAEATPPAVTPPATTPLPATPSSSSTNSGEVGTPSGSTTGSVKGKKERKTSSKDCSVM